VQPAFCRDAASDPQSEVKIASGGIYTILCISRNISEGENAKARKILQCINIDIYFTYYCKTPD
jgi:hypothetical protein